MSNFPSVIFRTVVVVVVAVAGGKAGGRQGERAGMVTVESKGVPR